jgi:hypothetical protein
MDAPIFGPGHPFVWGSRDVQWFGPNVAWWGSEEPTTDPYAGVALGRSPRASVALAVWWLGPCIGHRLRP